HFFPWWWEPAYSIDGADVGPLDPEEAALCGKNHLSDGQIAFRRQLQRQFRGLAPQEYAEDPTQCFLASGECVFDLRLLDARVAELGRPAESRDNDRVLIWLPPAPAKRYVMGVDPAGGKADGDFSAAQVIERDTGAQCAEIRGHIPPADLARQVATLGREY